MFNNNNILTWSFSFYISVQTRTATPRPRRGDQWSSAKHVWQHAASFHHYSGTACWREYTKHKYTQVYANHTDVFFSIWCPMQWNVYDTFRATLLLTDIVCQLSFLYPLNLINVQLSFCNAVKRATIQRK